MHCTIVTRLIQLEKQSLFRRTIFSHIKPRMIARFFPSGGLFTLVSKDQRFTAGWLQVEQAGKISFDRERAEENSFD